jgi:glucosamine--fructose-6-phosphate aminotransferase (isomerizing)
MLAGTPVEVECTSEFCYRSPILLRGVVIAAISQSGIGIVSGVGPCSARSADAGFYLHIGPEISEASTRIFTGQVIAVLVMAMKIAKLRNTCPLRSRSSIAMP